ncbi:hypothetical protein VaNZ11_005168, partial [Volvox africanus]
MISGLKTLSARIVFCVQQLDILMSLQRHCLVASRRGLKPAIVLTALPREPKPRRDCKTILTLRRVSITLPHQASLATLAASPVVQAVSEAIRPQHEPAILLQPSRTAPCCLSIVTGASRGLGAAIARVLVMLGPPLPAPASRAIEATFKTHSDNGAEAAGTGGNHIALKAVSPSPCAPLGLTHDLVLLASDSVRLSQFVRVELAPLLEEEEQQRHQEQQHHHQRQHSGEHGKPKNHPLSPSSSPLQQTIVASHGDPDGRPPSISLSEAVIASQPAKPETSKLMSGITRVHTACFDLGDLDRLKKHVSELLTAAPNLGTNTSRRRRRRTGKDVGLEPETSSATSAVAAEPAGTASTALTGSDRVTADALKATSTITVAVPSRGGNDCNRGVGRGSGLLPLPLSAYTHVLLVHNAGQVGDLVPLEHQSLANIRRQTDLNVTSFAHLTAAVLRSFLNAPMQPAPAESEGCNEGATVAARAVSQQVHHPGTERAGASRAAEGDRQPDLQAPRPETLGTETSVACGDSAVQLGTDIAGASPAAEAAPNPSRESQQRRVITIVNISSVSVDQPYEHFSLYGMGKAARHMIIRSIAHEAALREAELASVAVAAAAAAATEEEEKEKEAKAVLQGGTAPLLPRTPSPSQDSLGSDTRHNPAAKVARVRALSYAPGPIDTEMQAAAREALPPGPLKARFEDNARCGRLVDPWASAQVLYDILAEDM